MARVKVTRRRAAAVALLGAGAAATGAVVFGGGGASGGGASASASSTSTATTTIKRQDLVEVDTEDGTLGYSDSRSVVNRLSGTVTWLPSIGSTVRADHALYKVDGSPVILMNGSVPAYRTLKSGISDGVDVRQLERSLRAHGYDPAGAIAVDRAWTAATTAAVERWQLAHGLAQSGSIGLGRVVFLPGSRRISSTDVTLGGSTTGSGGGGGGSATPASTTSAVRMVYAAYQAPQATTTRATTTPAPATTTPATTTPAPATTTPAPATTTPAPATTTPAPATTTPAKPDKQPAAKPAEAPAAKASSSPSGARGGSSSPAASSAAAAASPDSTGGGASAANTLMTTTSLRRVVTVKLPTTKSALVKAGRQVTVTLPSGDDVHGRISSVGKVATAPADDSATGGGSGDATIKVAIRLVTSRTGLDQAPVTVRFEQSRRKHVLAIPVTALLAQPGGAFAVQVVQADGTRRTVPVQPGLYTSGFVEISGDGVRAGQRVTNAAVQ